MTEQELKLFNQKVKRANFIQKRIKDISELLDKSERLYLVGGIISINHHFVKTNEFRFDDFDQDEEDLALIDQKIYALVRAEYKALLEKLKAEFAALT